MKIRHTALILVLLIMTPACSESGPEDPGETDNNILIGALYEDAGGNKPEVEALRMVIQDINDSEVFENTFDLAISLFNSSLSDRTEMARELIEETGVIAIASEWSSTAKLVLQVTNKEHTDVVQCSGSSTNTRINNTSDYGTEDEDGVLGADTNDTLYRTVTNDVHQAKLVWNLVNNKDKVGVYYLNDAYGESFADQVEEYATADDKVLAFRASWSEQSYDVGSQQSNLDEITRLNDEDKLDSLIMVGLPSQGGIVLNALLSGQQTDWFNGKLIVPDGMIDQGFFTSLQDSFTTWLTIYGNEIQGTAPENYSGDHSTEWLNRLKDFSTGIDDSDAFIPSHADCLYAFAIALLYAGADASTAKDIKDNLSNLKSSNLESDAVEVGPTAEGLQAAKAAIADGKTVRLNGASGIIEFDDDGDRSDQPYKTYKIESNDTGYTWVTDSVWRTNGECISNCD